MNTGKLCLSGGSSGVLTDSAGVGVEVYVECCWLSPVVAMETLVEVIVLLVPTV